MVTSTYEITTPNEWASFTKQLIDLEHSYNQISMYISHDQQAVIEETLNDLWRMACDKSRLFITRHTASQPLVEG